MKKEETVNTTHCKPLVSLAELDVGSPAIVTLLPEILQVTGKLEAMGIIPGTAIVKKSASFMKGPIVIEKGTMQVAIGFQTAQKIIVRPLKAKAGGIR